MTIFGKFLRKTNLEFLPFVWFILKGNLSFIGPRPMLRDELEEYAGKSDCLSIRLSVRPGIIGFSTIESEKNNIFVEDENLKKNQFQYANNCSLNLDFKTFCGSVAKLFKQDK